MSNYYYLDVLLEFSKDQDRDITPAFFKSHVLQCINQVFGETAAAIPVDVLKYQPRTKEAILRVHKDQYVKVRSSLTLCGNYEGAECIYRIPEDHKVPSTVKLPELEPQPGLILPNGEINWNCPCLGGMATGPCGVEFRNAFSCFHYSTAEPKGSDCFELFKTMQNCMKQYPTLYSKDLGEDEENINMPDQPMPDEPSRTKTQQ
ncbi:coiled-coil-helix-coiled-coil-helix domain containing 4 [Holotrichia oblita]|uniref:Coiled-coil-helix-coiled-coil-helix domain containing 4 n=2 Tax=Holotrichia oblita TaxID=644536 RepID=A0ACB9TJY5_HOLOL|nr:coiled-coil-helix-coiled-coil-helix domain containing 4 [Holotrichia oblita]KAI4467129.1 coiled-coil-helix-coiled-coil-helix domain containing 4 [Holotrichia oblita]